jgi:hypothetical protein
MVLYQIFVFGADLKSNMAARVHNVFSLFLASLVQICFVVSEKKMKM